jgi:uncharacterized protein YbgA (DUF1722 family)/uncharacterized protein YbbK (DUF523 family)
MTRDASERPIRIGVSACLLGAEVRYDGGHKRDPFLVDVLGRHVEWLPVCPEAEAGFGTPRPAMRLVEQGGRLRLLTVREGEDVTGQLERQARKRIASLDDSDLCGWVLKKDSPSCGMERVKVYSEHGMPARSGRGLFAARLMERFPELPIEEEGRLSDPRLRENFIERVFAYRRLHTLFSGRWTVGDLVDFHTAHKLTLMAHSPVAYRALGRLVAGAKASARAEVATTYRRQFMQAMATIATTKRHVNVLQHIAGYLRGRADDVARTELATAIEDYRRELVPLVVPITLARHFVRAFDLPYLAGQTYLEPHPKELMLRNRV